MNRHAEQIAERQVFNLAQHCLQRMILCNDDTLRRYAPQMSNTVYLMERTRVLQMLADWRQPQLNFRS